MRTVERLRRATDTDLTGETFPVVYVTVGELAYRRYEEAKKTFRRVMVDRALNHFELRMMKIALLDMHFDLFYGGEESLNGLDTVEVLHPLGEAAFRGLN